MSRLFRFLFIIFFVGCYDCILVLYVLTQLSDIHAKILVALGCQGVVDHVLFAFELFNLLQEILWRNDSPCHF